MAKSNRNIKHLRISGRIVPAWLQHEITRRAWYVFQLSMKRVTFRCPRWARTRAIEDEFLYIYKRGQLNTYFRKEGCSWHVDHIVPLKGERVCGLHVPWNLHVIPAAVNMAKGIMVVDEWLTRDMIADERAARKQREENRVKNATKRKALNIRRAAKQKARRERKRADANDRNIRFENAVNK